jgi:hypothetical protein
VASVAVLAKSRRVMRFDDVDSGMILLGCSYYRFLEDKLILFANKA